MPKKDDGTWLDMADLAAVAVDEAHAVPMLLDGLGNRNDFVNMDPFLCVNNPQHFGEASNQSRAKLRCW